MQEATDFPKFCPNCGQRRVIGMAICAGCGFEWVGVTNPAQAFGRKLKNLTNEELLIVFKLFYPFFNKEAKIATLVAERTGLSLSMVSKVINGDRKSSPVDAAIANVLREKLSVVNLDIMF